MENKTFKVRINIKGNGHNIGDEFTVKKHSELYYEIQNSDTHSGWINKDNCEIIKPTKEEEAKPIKWITDANELEKGVVYTEEWEEADSAITYSYHKSEKVYIFNEKHVNRGYFGYCYKIDFSSVTVREATKEEQETFRKAEAEFKAKEEPLIEVNKPTEVKEDEHTYVHTIEGKIKGNEYNAEYLGEMLKNAEMIDLSEAKSSEECEAFKPCDIEQLDKLTALGFMAICQKFIKDRDLGVQKGFLIAEFSGDLAPNIKIYDKEIHEFNVTENEEYLNEVSLLLSSFKSTVKEELHFEEEIKPKHYMVNIQNRKTKESVECDYIDIAEALDLSNTQFLTLRYMRKKGDLTKQINDTEKGIESLTAYLQILKNRL